MPATLESPIESGSLPSFSASSTVSKCNIGLAVLPSRLKTEMAELADALVKQCPVEAYSENITKHAQWAQELQEKYVFTHENAAEILRKEIGMVFARVLEDAGVYKLNESGREGFVRFLASIN